jgi:aspartate racemase
MTFTKTIGILGGMGPYASIDIYRIILDSIQVEKEWEYPHVIINSNPTIPSRTRAFLFGETSPVPDMIAAAKALERAGADFILLPCNSAHYFLNDVKAEVGIEIVDLIAETCRRVADEHPSVKRVAVLGGEVTLQGGLYQKGFKPYGISVEPITPSAERTLRQGIDMIKHNRREADVLSDFFALVEGLVRSGAHAVILACTEFPLIFRDLSLHVPLIDPNFILAQVAIGKAK